MASGSQILRIGVVDPVGAIDPRAMAEATTILLARQMFETRKDRREETLGEIGQLMGRDVPLVPLMYGRAGGAHAWRLRGFQPTVTGLVDLAALTLT